MATRTLTRGEARRFYDRIGSRQDSQGFYEDLPLEDLKAHSDFEHARRVVEFGCGTGKFALDLFHNRLLPDALYLGLEASPVMADLTRRRLEPFADRAAVVLTDGRPAFPVADGSLDRVVSNYVLDLLSESDIEAFLQDAHRALRRDGRLCLTGLGHGQRGIPRLASWLWKRVHRLRPALVGGCRPLDVRPFLDPTQWRILHCQTVVASQIPSQTLVIRKVQSPKSKVQSLRTGAKGPRSGVRLRDSRLTRTSGLNFPDFGLWTLDFGLYPSFDG